MHTVQVPTVVLHKQFKDDALCEVETAKAVFPVESSVEGVLKEWLIEEEDDVEVGQKLALIQLSNGVAESEPENTTPLHYSKYTSRPLPRSARTVAKAVVQPP